MLREQRVRDQDFCSLSGRLVSMCHHTWSFVAATDRPGVLPYRPRAPREAARVHRVRVDCLASSSPDKAGGVTGLLRHAGTNGNGHCGGFTRRAVEAWPVQSIPECAWAFGSSPVCGVDVVGATCPFSARKPLRAWSERAAGFLSPSSRSRRTPSTPSMTGRK